MSKKTTLEEGLLGALGGAALGGGLGYVGGAAAGGALKASKGVKDAATGIGSKIATVGAAGKAAQAGKNVQKIATATKTAAQATADKLRAAAGAPGLKGVAAKLGANKAAHVAANINPAQLGAGTTADYLSKASAAGAKKAAGIVSNLPKTGRAVGAATGAVVGGVVGNKMTKKEGKQIRNMKSVSPKSKGGIGGDGGYIMDSFNAAYNNVMEYYTAPTPKKKLKEEDEEKEGMSNAAKTAAALGISVTALLAMSPSARAAAMKLGKKAIGSVKDAGDKMPSLFKDGKPITFLGKGPTP